MAAASLRGYAYKGQVYLSKSLSGSVKRFVMHHEIYHLGDKHSWGGYFGMELRANVSCGLRDPAGLLLTILGAIKSRNLGVYFRRLSNHSN